MKIYYGNGEVRLEGVNNLAAFDIRFKGIISAESELPSSWSMMNNKKRIIGFNLGDLQPELLFTYEGELRILSCKLVDRELNEYRAIPTVEGLGFWGGLNTKFEDFTQYPEDYDGTYVTGSIPRTTSIHQVNLQTEQGEWFLEDGTPYYGEYHLHGNGQAMTESKHTKESKNIFRKDAKGNISKLKKVQPRTTRAVRTTRTTRRTGGGGY